LFNLGDPDPATATMDFGSTTAGVETHHVNRSSGSDKADGAALRHRRSSDADAQADQALEALGYKPELSRSRSTLQVAFMSFVLASIPYGLATTLYYPLIGGGPVNIIWGWLGVSMIIVCVAASLGEITSVYPTAGGNSLPPFTFVELSSFVGRHS
jgi:amino acid permease